MTDRVSGFVVALDADIREDDAQQIITALRMIRGVVGVTPVVADVSDYVNRNRISTEIKKKIYDVLGTF